MALPTSSPMPMLSTAVAPRAETYASRDPFEGTTVRHPVLEPSAPTRPLVLVVDDHEDSRVIARVVLEAAGFSVSEAAGGVEGLRLAVSLQPVVILLDLILPGIDGWEVARRLRRDPAASSVGII